MKTTSLQRFNDALWPLEGAVTVTRETVKLTVSDPTQPNPYRWARSTYLTKIVEATLVTVRGKNALNIHRKDGTTIQALFDQQGRFLGGCRPFDDGQSAADVARNSRISVSAPFDGPSASLTDLLGLLAQFDPAAVAAAEAEEERREAQIKEREDARREADRQEARDRMMIARAKARMELGHDVATPAVLDYFLPLDTEAATRE